VPTATVNDHAQTEEDDDRRPEDVPEVDSRGEDSLKDDGKEKDAHGNENDAPPPFPADEVHHADEDDERTPGEDVVTDLVAYDAYVA